NGGSVNFPAYDKAADVYSSLLNQLDTAIIIINNAPATAENPGKFDVMFQGNMAEWILFANTIKLKIAMNLTQATGGAAIIQSALNGLTSASFLGPSEDAAVNP